MPVSYPGCAAPRRPWALRYIPFGEKNESTLRADDPDFRLYGIGTRFPKKLFDRLAARGMVPVQRSPGVFDIAWGTVDIRLLVIADLPDTDANALLQFFSDREESVKSAQKRYRMKSTRMSTLVLKLLGVYELEGKTVPYTMEDFDREFKEEFLGKLTPQERVAGLPAEERLRGLPAEERLRGLPAEERLRGLPPEEFLKVLSPDELRKLRDLLIGQKG